VLVVKGGFGGHDMCCATMAVGMVKQEVVWVVGRVVLYLEYIEKVRTPMWSFWTILLLLF